MLFGASGVVALLCIAVPGPLPSGRLAVLGTVVLLVAVVVWVMPWERWPTRATLVLVLPAFGLIGVSEATGLLPDRAYSIMFVVVFVWIGVHHPPRSAWLIAPVAAGAYAVPMAVDHANPPLDGQALVMVVVAGVFVAETIARGAERRRISEREVRLLADNTTDLVVRSGVDGVIRYASPSAFGMLGWRPEEVIGRSVVELCHPDEISPAAAIATSPAGTPVTVIRRVLRADGGYSWVESVARVVPGIDGDVEVQASMRDVTERRAAEEARAASEERHRITLDALEEATALYRVDGAALVPTLMNRAARRLMGVDVGEFGGVFNVGVPDTIAEDGSPIGPADTAAAIAARTGRPVEGSIVGLRRDDATVTWLRVTAHPILDASGTVVMVATTATDITESWATQKALDAAQARFASMVEHSSDLITITGADRCLSYASPAFGHIFGEDASSHLGRPLWELVHPEDRERVGAIFADLKARPGGVAAFECRIVRADGSIGHVQVTQTNLLDNPAVQGFIGNAHDITDRVEAANRLSHQATHDSLTGLPNRELLIDRLTLALARSTRSHTPIALLFIDLDGFKQVNDRLGHDSGDMLLTEVARRLIELTRPSDIVARFGGDEFVAVLEDMHELEAFAVAERFQATLARPYRLSSGIGKIKASIGVATSTPGSTVDELLAAADRSMYAVKADHARENSTARQT